jgi:CBS domain-containing protein
MISEVMTRNVQTISPKDTVQHAAQLMDDLNVGALPVCDEEQLVGMITDRDITVRGVSSGLASDAMVDQIMSTDVRWCFEDQSVDEVMRQMSNTQIRRVPVISHDDAQRLIGIVSIGDVTTKADKDGAPFIEQTIKNISSPSEPDRSSPSNAHRSSSGAGTIAPSDTDTATGLVGSDYLSDTMNPGIEVSSTEDPSNMVEVTPDKLVNKNAPGSRSVRSTRTEVTSQSAQDRGVSVVHKAANKDSDTSTGETGESGAPGGIHTAGPSGGSGGPAGIAGSAGTDIGAKP